MKETVEGRIDFIEDLLKEAEVAEAKQRIEVDKLKADSILAALSVLESQMTDVDDLVQKETSLLEEYRSSELSRLEKKRSWLEFNLQGFMRSTGEKTVRLPHGILKLRKQKDRVAVVAMDGFLPKANLLGLIRCIPESFAPDNQAIIEYVTRTGEIPPGVEYIPGETKFTYLTIKGGSNEGE